MRKAMIYLQKFGISTTLAAKIYQFYGPKTYQVLEGNPYQLADQIQGIGFKIADEIATKIGIHSDSDFRIRSGIFYTLQQSVAEGHVYLTKDVLLRRASALLEVEIKDIEKYLMDLSMEKDVYKRQKEKRVVFFEGKSWYHRTKELQDDLTTKYGKKGGFETPEEAEKSYWEYEKRYQKKQRDLQIAKMQKTDVMLGDYLEYWFENIFSLRIETTTRMVGAYTL